MLQSEQDFREFLTASQEYWVRHPYGSCHDELQGLFLCMSPNSNIYPFYFYNFSFNLIILPIFSHIPYTLGTS